ncbi:hypothetical protein EON66_02080 [archaeon]|nr:MAG: hypothetical protein EON66_02080 [archaeon]
MTACFCRSAILSALLSGTAVIVDRYAMSGAAYSSAKCVPGMTLPWCMSSDEGLPAPDVTLFMHAGVSHLEQRADFGGERYVSRAAVSCHACPPRTRDKRCTLRHARYAYHSSMRGGCGARHAGTSRCPSCHEWRTSSSTWQSTCWASPTSSRPRALQQAVQLMTLLKL